MTDGERPAPGSERSPERRRAVADGIISLTGLARHVVVAGVSGVIAGVLVGGLGGRLFMRISGAIAPELAQGARTEAGFTVGQVSVVDSIFFVIFVGLFAGIVGGVFYVIFRPWLAWTGRFGGVTFGLLLFAIASATSDVMNPDNIDFFILKNSAFLVVLIVALFLGFGVVVDTVFGFLDQRLVDEEGKSPGMAPLWFVLAGLGFLIGVPSTVGTLFASGNCSCEPPIGVAVGVVVTALGTGLLWISVLMGRDGVLALLARLAGYGGLAAAAAFGIVRAVADAMEIVG